MTGILVTKLVSYSKGAPMPILCRASRVQLLNIFICNKYACICKTAVLRIFSVLRIWYIVKKNSATAHLKILHLTKITLTLTALGGYLSCGVLCSFLVYTWFIQILTSLGSWGFLLLLCPLFKKIYMCWSCFPLQHKVSYSGVNLCWLQ